MKKILLKKYVTVNYLKNSCKDFIKKDLVLCNIYLKVTNNLLYDPTLNLMFEMLKEKGFKWYLKNPKIIIYKKVISIADFLFLLSLKNLYCLTFKLQNNYYFNLTPSQLGISNIPNFFGNFYSFFFTFFFKMNLIIKMYTKAIA